VRAEAKFYVYILFGMAITSGIALVIVLLVLILPHLCKAKS